MCGSMSTSSDAWGAARRPDPAALSELASMVREFGPGSGLYPGTIVSVDAGHLFYSLATGGELSLPSAVATGDTYFAPNLNPAFFYSFDVHRDGEQTPDQFRVSVRFTPSDFGISEALSYEVEWVALVPVIIDPASVVLTLTASPNPGSGVGDKTLEGFGPHVMRLSAGPIRPDETLRTELIRNSWGGSWMWARTTISYLPPTRR